MRSLRYVFMFVVVVAFAAVAEAQCMYCQQQPGQTGNEGICVESNGDYCTTACCGGWPGMGCPIGDAFHLCGGWQLAKDAETSRPMLQRAIQRNEPAFTSRLLLVHKATQVHRRLACPAA